ncbi:MAG TPA: OmpA family protein [Vicinamibacterales bacterium]|nr:OmpA family protein [Vicinamibacterales bacterium]
MFRGTVTLVCLMLLYPAWGRAAEQSGSSSGERSALAIRYEEGKSTDIRVDGTALAPRLRGKAKIKAERGNAAIEIELDDLPPAINVAPGYATYVLWAILPDGRTENLGEFPWRDDPKLKTSLPVQRFALLVTAEPYGAVARPSPLIVAENKLKDGESVATTSGIAYQGDDGSLYGGSGPETDAKTPEPVAAARLAVQVARRAGAETFAKGELEQAVDTLSRMEAQYQDKPKDEGRWGSFARETQRLAHAARTNAGSRRADAALADERQAQAKALEQARLAANAAQEAARMERERATAERLAAERATAEQRAAIAEAERAAAEQRAALAEAERARQAATAAERQSLAAQQQSLAAQKQAEEARKQAEDARLQAELAQRDAEQARVAQQAAFEQASAAMKRAEQATQERDALAQQLETSLNSILETRRSTRGLVVNIGDVLFDFGQASLRPEARERLSRLSGVLLAYPGPYTLEFEGHTDSIGSDEFNNRLSDARAAAVRDYVVGAGISGERVVGARGFGKANPVANNETAEGRQQNRRVEIVINDAR